MTEILKETLQEVINAALTPCKRVGEIFENYFGEDKIELFIPPYYTDYYTETAFAGDLINYFGGNIDSEDENATIELLHSKFLDLNEEAQRTVLLNFLVCKRLPLFNLTIYFPEVTITNENGNSTNIKNLFVRFDIHLDGELCGYFGLLRSHYTYAHFKNNYMHSHVANIPLSDPTQFQGCCTGSGPINQTMRNLHAGFDENQWMQFCWDIDKYVHVESLIGVPYHRLVDADCETSATNKLENYYSGADLSRISTPLRKDFIKYIIESNKINFRWARNNWEIAHSFSEFTCIVSTLFLQWVKEIPRVEDYTEFIERLMLGVVYRSTGIYVSNTYRTNINDIDLFVGKEIINFKGISFIGEVDAPINQDVKLKVLKPEIIKDVSHLLVKTLNTYYGRKQNEIFS